MQGTWVRALVREDPTCRGATKPVRHNYWACALQPVSHNYWARVPQLLSPCATTTEASTPRACAPWQERPPQWEAYAPQWRVAPARHNQRKACTQQRRPNAAKNKIINLFKKKISENWDCRFMKDIYNREVSVYKGYVPLCTKNRRIIKS